MFVVNNLDFFISHRLPIALAAQKSDYQVHIGFGSLGNTSPDILFSQGFRLHYLPIQRGGMNLFADLYSIFLLLFLFRRIRPDIVHLVTIKPVLYGGIAAQLAGVPAVLSAMAGLGFLFVKRSNLLNKILRLAVEFMFRFAMGHKNQKLVFQNPDDRDRILSFVRISSHQIKLIRGSGINLADFPILPEPSSVPIIAMAARLLRDKGVFEFVEAARILSERKITARFWLIGDLDLANPTSVTPKEFTAWQKEGVVECLGYRKDVPRLFSQATIVTLPSYYGEGLPKCLIEAAACGRAVVTTDMPGCRDAIEPDVTGLLVPPRNSLALADAIESLIKNSSVRQSMGKAGRLLAEREFGIDRVVAAHLQIYKELLEEYESC